MNKHDKCRLVQKYVTLAISVAKLAEVILKLLNMVINYHLRCPQHATA